ncbi:MAG: hypothetical protein HRT53_01865 [Colwellia sp.]|nr:hypothetical protein [Colwellia sp.]
MSDIKIQNKTDETVIIRTNIEVATLKKGEQATLNSATTEITINPG